MDGISTPSHIHPASNIIATVNIKLPTQCNFQFLLFPPVQLQHHYLISSVHVSLYHKQRARDLSKYKCNHVSGLNYGPLDEGVWRNGGRAAHVLEIGCRLKLCSPRPNQMDSEKEPTVGTGKERPVFKSSVKIIDLCLNYVKRLRTKINMNYSWRVNPYRTVNTLRLGYKDESVNVV